MSLRVRNLWLLFTTAFALALIGAAVLLTPTLEFYAVDLIERLHLPIGPVGNFALYFELVLLIGSTLGLITLTLRALFRRESPKRNP